MFGWFKKKEKKADAPKAEEPKKEEVKGPVIVNPAPEEEPVGESKPAEEKSEEKSYGAYFVSPHPDGGWQVKKAKAKKALKRFDTKAEAEKYAKQVAENQGTNVVRQKKDGKIQKKH